MIMTTIRLIEIHLDYIIVGVFITIQDKNDNHP